MNSKVLLVVLSIFSAIFFGLTSLFLIQLAGNHYTYLLALPIAMGIFLLFTLDKYLFFTVVLITRSSLDAAFDSIKFGSFGLGAIMNALVIIIAVLLYFERKDYRNFHFTPITSTWFLFLLFSFFTVFYSPVTLASVKVFLQFISYAAMFYLGYALTKTDEDLAKWLKAIVYSGFIPLLYGVYSLVFGGGGASFYLAEGLRVLSTFNHPNPFSFYLVLVITITFYVYKAQPPFINKRLIKILPIYILGLLFLLLMTKTRAAWAACGMFFFLYSIFFERKLLLYMALSCFLLLLVPDVQDRIIDLQSGNDFGSTGYGKLNSWAWRKKYWHDSIAWMSESHYFFGYGLRSFMHYSTIFGQGNAFSRQDFELNAHSVYIQFFFELGLFGLTSFVALIFVHFKKLLSLYEKNKLLVFTALILLIEYSLENVTDNIMDYLNYVWYLWFIVGMVIAYVQNQLPSKRFVKD